MAHEPECPGGEIGELESCPICALLLEAWRRGYNDHARTVQHWQDTHGAYRHCADSTCWCNRDDVRVALYVQHGEGENP